MIPLFRLIARPSGYTSTSLAVQSVSGALVAANSVRLIGPVTSTGVSSGGAL